MSPTSKGIARTQYTSNSSGGVPGSLLFASTTPLSIGGSQGPNINLDTEGTYDWWTMNAAATASENFGYPSPGALTFAAANRGSFGRFRTQLFGANGGASALATAGAPAFAPTTVGYFSNNLALIFNSGSTLTGVTNQSIALTNIAYVAIDPNIPFGGWLAWIPLPTGRTVSVNVHFALRACTASIAATLLDGAKDISVSQAGISGGSSGTFFNFYRSTFTAISHQYMPVMLVQITETAGVSGLPSALAMPAITLALA